MNMTKNKPAKLPKKLSACIRVACDDLTKAERSPLYKISMNVWHAPNSVCRVCFAGAVMAFSLKVAHTELSNPAFLWDEYIQDRLYALDYARSGMFNYALDCLGPRIRRQLPVMPKIPRYSRRNPKPFKAAMRKAATILEKAGY